MEVTVIITIDELLKLDGICSEKTQKMINDYRVSTGELMIDTPYEFVKAALLHAVRVGEFRSRTAHMEVCLVCGKKAGYTTYKVGLLKGEPNYRSPIRFWGMNLVYNQDKKVNGQVCTDCEIEHDFEGQIQRFITKHNLNVKLYESSKNKWGHFQKVKRKI